jgi:hypothetical protein
MTNRRRPAPNAPGGPLEDIFEDLRSEGHLTARQHLAGMLLLRDLQAAHGRSAGLVGSPSEKVQTGASERICPPGGLYGIAEMDRRLNRLRPHERRLMSRLVTCREKARGSLPDLGRLLSGYKTAKTTRAVMVGRVGGLLDSVAEIWLGPEIAP